MPKTLLQKMFYKPKYSLCILNVPKELQKDFGEKYEANIKSDKKYAFLLAFFNKKTELEKEITKIKDSLDTNGVLWIAYPKAKMLETDLNRDILHTLMAEYKFDGVSLVSLSDTWSAMRFKRL